MFLLQKNLNPIFFKFQSHQNQYYYQDGLNPDNFIFKVVGKGEYVYGTKEKMMDFEYVRYCIRHSQDISFALIYVPPEKRCVTPYPIEWLNPVQYATTFFFEKKS